MHALIEVAVVPQTWSVDWLNQNHPDTAEIQIAGPQPRPTELASPGLRRWSLHLNKLFRSCRCMASFGSPADMGIAMEV